MFNYLFNLTDIYLFVMLSFLFTFISVLALFLIKKRITLVLRYESNAVIGNTASLISVIYGVLAGLSALYLINNNSYTADAVQREANAVRDIYRDSKWLDLTLRKPIQIHIKNYLDTVVYYEWPLLRKGKNFNDDYGNRIIEGIFNELILNKNLQPQQTMLVQGMLEEVRFLYDARQQRIHMSHTQLSPELWIVIIIGSILTLCINYLFGVNFYLHIILVIAAALITSSMIFLLITLDRPFQGEFAITAEAFQLIDHSISRRLH